VATSARQRGRHVDQQRKPPGGGGEQATEQRAGPEPGGPDRRPDGQRPGPLPSRGKTRADQPEHRRLKQRRAQPLRRPRTQQQRRVSGRRPGPARGAEKRHRDDEHARGPEPVGQSPAHDQEPREEDGVRADHPLSRHGRQVQVAGDAGQRQVDDRVVQRDQELRDRHHGQGHRRPAVASGPLPRCARQRPGQPSNSHDPIVKH
jgi:hypothetical protein